jgi:hypothetical protein
MTDLTTALEAHKPNLEARFISFTTARFNRLVEQFGPALRGVYNSGQYRNWQAIAGCTVSLGDRVNSEYALDDARLAAAAKHFAEETVAAWAAKIEAKLGELADAEVRHLDGARFNIIGRKGDRRVRIEQDMIVNVSNKGTLFNQFPARIYVDGKFMSAAKFAAL